MSSKEVKLSFNDWIKTKKYNDYWFYPDSPDDFALATFKQHKNLLESGELSCRQFTWFVSNKCNLACEHCGVSANDIKYFVEQEKVPQHLIDPLLSDPAYGEKQPIFRAQSGTTRLTIFEGGHELIIDAVTNWLIQNLK